MNIFLHSIDYSDIYINCEYDKKSCQQILNNYSQRSIILGGKNDVVIINKEIDKNYLEYLNGLELGLSHRVIVPCKDGTIANQLIKDASILIKIKAYAANNNPCLYPYLSGTTEKLIATQLNIHLMGSEPDLTYKVNNKIWFIKMLKMIGIQTVKGTVKNQVQLVTDLKNIFKSEGNVIVRARKSLGGKGVWIINHLKDIKELIDITKVKPDSSYLVEQFHSVQCSPNIQFVINNGEIKILGITDQLFKNGVEYAGSIYPSTISNSKLIILGKKIGRFLESKGYKGIVGIDFIITEDGKIFPIEANARVNSSTFGLSLLRRLYKKNNIMFKYIDNHTLTNPLSISDILNVLRNNKILIEKRNEFGVLPCNPFKLKYGHIDFFIFHDNTKSIEIIETTLEKII